MSSILEISNISKKYIISHQTAGYLSLRDRIANTFVRNKKSREDFWALDDISFDVKPGESVGIIGRNGAGKSTLLKVLSKITKPTTGRIVTRGRIASLLEVGTGFHPELTGRENIFFNGSLLGMRRSEIESKFDSIVDFSGVERFLDTQLKHYSSGMQLRLAFSVAAFLEPEILVIDEVLAVGDAEFQKKCLGKMEDVSKSGRTILFVSHQLGLITQLCQTGILLQSGKILAKGPASGVIEQYNQSSKESNEFSASSSANKDYALMKIRTLNSDGTLSATFAHDEPLRLEIEFSASQTLANTHLCVSVNNKYGQRIFSTDQLLVNYSTSKPNLVTITIPGETLTPGEYSFFIAIHCPNTIGYDLKDPVCHFSVYDNGSDFVQYENRWFYGDVFVKCKWEFNF